MTPRSHWSHIRTSFQVKLLIIFTSMTFILASLLGTVHTVNEIREARRNAAEQLQLQARQLSDSVRLPLYAENSYILRQLAEQASEAPEISAVVISAPDGRLLADVHSPDPPKPTGMISKSVQVLSSSLVDSVESSMTSGRGNSVTLLGNVRLERRTADLSRNILQVIVFTASIATAFWLAVSLLCYLVLLRLTRSFNALMNGVNIMQGGDFTYRINIESNDEAGRAANAINNLANALQQRGEENVRLQKEHLNIERQRFNAQKLESLGVMAGGIAHDFNNLLQVIVGNMELAAMKLDEDSAPNKYISRSITSAKRAALLTNSMLTYVGKGFITKKELDLNELVRENAEILSMATSKATLIKILLSPGLPAIMADEAHIQQVVMNLITNAAESMEEQPGAVMITTGTQSCDQDCLATSLLDERSEPGRYVFLEVSDDGCGMSEETLKRLFDPFFTTKFTGRGLGMSAVMGIIRAHHGALFVESELGKGTTFRALFPISASALPAAAQNQISSTPGKCSTQESPPSGVALVVDDEKSVLKVCTTMVKLCGFTVITACDGIDAVTKFREHADEIVVVLMDLTMPNMDGIAAMSEIYRIRPNAKVIIASGFNEDELSERLNAKTPSGFIRKPYSMNALETELRRVVTDDVTP